MAVKADVFMAMKKDEGRAFIKPYRVVYVYHNQIDAVVEEIDGLRPPVPATVRPRCRLVGDKLVRDPPGGPVRFEGTAFNSSKQTSTHAIVAGA